MKQGIMTLNVEREMIRRVLVRLAMLVVFYLIILLPISIIGSIVERKVRYAGFGS